MDSDAAQASNLPSEKLERSFVLGSLKAEAALRDRLKKGWAHLPIKFHRNVHREFHDPKSPSLRGHILDQAALLLNIRRSSLSWEDFLIFVWDTPQVFSEENLDMLMKSSLVEAYGEAHTNAENETSKYDAVYTSPDARSQAPETRAESLSEISTTLDPLVITVSANIVTPEIETTSPISSLQTLASAASLDSEGIISMLQDDAVQFFKARRCDPLPLAGNAFQMSQKEFAHIGHSGQAKLGLAIGQTISEVLDLNRISSHQFFKIAHTVLTSSMTKEAIIRGIGYTDVHKGVDTLSTMDVLFDILSEQNIGRPAVPGNWVISTYRQVSKELLEKYTVIHNIGRVTIIPSLQEFGRSLSSLAGTSASTLASNSVASSESNNAESPATDSPPAPTPSSEVSSVPFLPLQSSGGNVSSQPFQPPVLASNWDLPGYEIDPEVSSEVGSDDDEAVEPHRASRGYTNQGYNSDEGSPTQDFTLLTQSPVSVAKGKLAELDDFPFLGQDESYNLSSNGSDQSMVSNDSAARSATCDRVHCSSDGSFYISDARYDDSGSSQSTDPGERLRMRLLMDVRLLKEGLSVYGNHFNYAKKMTDPRSTKDYMVKPHKCFKRFAFTKLEQMRRALEFSDSDGDTSGSQSSSILSTDLFPANHDPVVDTSKELKQDSATSNKSAN